MERTKLAIVRAEPEISPEIMDSIIERIKASNDGLVFVADSFRKRDAENCSRSVDIESRVTGRIITTVIFFSRIEATFWRRVFPILKRVILITDKEESRDDGKIIVLNLNDISQFLEPAFNQE